MKYSLVFAPAAEDEKSVSLFINLYAAFLGSADNPNRARSLEETRSAIKVLDAIDSISERVPLGPRGEEVRSLLPQGGQIALEEPEYRLLKRCVDEFVGQAPLVYARAAIKLKEMVDNAPMSS